MNKSAASRKNVLKRVWVVIITPYYVTYIGSWMRVCKLIYHTKPHQMANTLKKKEGKGVVVMTLTKEQLMKALNLPLGTKIFQ